MSVGGRRPALLLLCLVAVAIWACGAATSPGSGELMFDFAAEEEDAAVDADASRRPLPLDGGP